MKHLYLVTRHQQLTVYTVTRCDHRQPAPAPAHAPAAAAAAGEQRTQRNLLRRGARHLDTWLQWIHRTAVTSFLIISPATCRPATVLYSQFLPGNDEWLPNDPSCRAICLRLAQIERSWISMQSEECVIVDTSVISAALAASLVLLIQINPAP